MEKMPLYELQLRYVKCRNLLHALVPEAGGMLISSRLSIYYLSGTLAAGFLWLPQEGEPLLLTHRGIERAKLESPLKNIAAFHSSAEIADICADYGSPLPNCLGIDDDKMSWSMGKRLETNLPGKKFVPCDKILRTARSVKTEWELEKLRITGEQHRRASEEILQQRIHPGMDELAIARTVITVFGEMGNGTVIRMNTHDEENYGMLAVGDSGNYPTYFNGCLGWRGQHPSSPFLGNAEVIWAQGKVLTVDFGFEIAGYNTDKTQIFWAGELSTVPEKILTAQNICKDIFMACAADLKPGSIPSEIWQKAAMLAKKAGQEAGFMGIAGYNKTRFLGHGVGLTVDDLPVLAKGFDAPLEKGMVIAIEPKIAMPNIGMVGVENTFEITETGAQSLTGNLIDIIPVA